MTRRVAEFSAFNYMYPPEKFSLLKLAHFKAVFHFILNYEARMNASNRAKTDVWMCRLARIKLKTPMGRILISAVCIYCPK